MDFSAVCRTCLRTTNLTPIFLNIEDPEKYSIVLYSTTGVKIEKGDGFPQNMCTDCVLFVNKSDSFRKQCSNNKNYLIKLTQEQSPTDTISFFHNYCRVRHEDIDVRDTIIKTEPLDDNSIDIKINVYDATESTPTEKRTESELENDENEKKKIKNPVELPYCKIHDGNEKTQRVRCKLCSKNLSIRSVDYHLIKHHPGADQRKVQCDLCDTFVIKEKLNRHTILMHGSGFFRCRYCKFEFGKKELLAEHWATCTAKKKKGRKLMPVDGPTSKVECDVCNIIVQRRSLKSHKRMMHGGHGPVCEYCGKKMGNQFRLKEHLRAKHGYQKLKCTYCEFESASTMALGNHERRHRGEKPYVCERCGAKFHARYLLARHRASHTTEKLFKCDQCSASFKVKNSLHMHRSACHSDKDYRCGICSQKFGCRLYIVKHMRRVHLRNGPDLPIVCEPTEQVASGNE